MEPSLLVRIAREIPRARTIFGGLGGVFLFEELMAGATGAMTGFAFPEILVRIVNAFHEGDIDHAADVFYQSVPLMRFEFQEGIGMAIRREVLRRRPRVGGDPRSRREARRVHARGARPGDDVGRGQRESRYGGSHAIITLQLLNGVSFDFRPLQAGAARTRQ